MPKTSLGDMGRKEVRPALTGLERSVVISIWLSSRADLLIAGQADV